MNTRENANKSKKVRDTTDTRGQESRNQCLGKHLQLTGKQEKTDTRLRNKRKASLGRQQMRS